MLFDRVFRFCLPALCTRIKSLGAQFNLIEGSPRAPEIARFLSLQKPTVDWLEHVEVATSRLRYRVVTTSDL